MRRRECSAAVGLLALVGFLMVSTWRYYSFKGINLSKPYTPLLLIVLGAFIYGVLNFSNQGNGAERPYLPPGCS